VKVQFRAAADQKPLALLVVLYVLDVPEFLPIDARASYRVIRWMTSI
jgi:hypothetical protein